MDQRRLMFSHEVETEENSYRDYLNRVYQIDRTKIIESGVDHQLATYTFTVLAEEVEMRELFARDRAYAFTVIPTARAHCIQVVMVDRRQEKRMTCIVIGVFIVTFLAIGVLIVSQ